MPLFEYRCQSCQKDFDVLELPGREINKACPACKSTSVVQKVSVFAAHSGSAAGSDFPAGNGGGCGRCGDPEGPCGS